MKVEALTAKWCGKCGQAKEILKDYPIHWIDYNSHMGKAIIRTFDVKGIPIFIINGESKTHSIYEVRDLFENAKET